MMQNTSQTICLAIILFFLTSCGPLYRTIFGIKKVAPREESTLKRFLLKTGCDTTDVYAVDSKEWQRLFNEGLPNKRVPEIMVFDRQGRYIPYAEVGKWICLGEVDPFIASLTDTGQYHISDFTTLERELSGLRALNGSYPAVADSTHDFVVLAYWAYFLGGNLARNNLPGWEQDAAGNTRARIRLIKVSLDPQLWWKPEHLEQLKRGKSSFSFKR